MRRVQQNSLRESTDVSSRTSLDPSWNHAVILVNGNPGAGKTTLARELSRMMDIPMISKDTIKEVLLEDGMVDSTRAGLLAVQIMYSLCSDFGTVILDNVFHAQFARNDLSSMGRPICEIYCQCPNEISRSRFERRAASLERSSGHGPWTDVASAPIGMGPLIVVDTSEPVNVSNIADWLYREFPL